MKKIYNVCNTYIYMEEPTIKDDLWNEYDENVMALERSEGEVIDVRANVKKLTEQLRKAKSGLYQACKIRKQLKNDVASSKRRAQGYDSYKRKVIIGLMEEDL